MLQIDALGQGRDTPPLARASYGMGPHCCTGTRARDGAVQPAGTQGGKAGCELVLGDVRIPSVETLTAVQPSLAAEDGSSCGSPPAERVSTAAWG